MTMSKLPSLIGIRSISKGGIFSINAREMDTKLLLAPELNNTLARCWFRRNIPVTTFGSWHDNASIRPEGFLSSVLLWLVIIVAVVGVGVTCALLPDLLAFGYVNGFLYSLKFRGGWAKEFHQDRARTKHHQLRSSSRSGVPVGITRTVALFVSLCFTELLGAPSLQLIS
ncbi:hypothetical protein Tco_0005917 [Tanacetum coccineum]